MAIMSQWINIKLLLIFCHFLVFLVKFSYWSMFHFSSITCCWVIRIFVYKGLTRKPEVGNTSVWDFANIWRRGKWWMPNLSRVFLMICYWILQNSRVAVITVSELLREKPAGGKLTSLPTPQIRVKTWAHCLLIVYDTSDETI